MKFVMAFMLTFACLNVFANDSKICAALEQKISDDCDHLACDDYIADGTFSSMSDCTSASDYGEYAQGVCDGQPTLQDLVKDYNKKHPNKKIKCEE